MSQDLCARGRELFKKASQADELFKARLLEFFSSAKKDDQEMKRIGRWARAIGKRTRLFIGIKGFAWSAPPRPLPCCAMPRQSSLLGSPSVVSEKQRSTDHFLHRILTWPSHASGDSEARAERIFTAVFKQFLRDRFLQSSHHHRGSPASVLVSSNPGAGKKRRVKHPIFFSSAEGRNAYGGPPCALSKKVSCALCFSDPLFSSCRTDTISTSVDKGEIAGSCQAARRNGHDAVTHPIESRGSTRGRTDYALRLAT